MPSDNRKKLQRIKSVSNGLRAACKGILVLITLAGISAVVCLTLGVGGVSYNDKIFSTAGLTLGHRLLLGAAGVLAFAALFNCFYQLHRLFGSYTRGEIFTRESVGQLRQFGIACLLWGVGNFLLGVSLALSMQPPKSFEGHFDSPAIGVVLIVIAWFMDMAVDLREENELTI